MFRLSHLTLLPKHNLANSDIDKLNLIMINLRSNQLE